MECDCFPDLLCFIRVFFGPFRVLLCGFSGFVLCLAFAAGRGAIAGCHRRVPL